MIVLEVLKRLISAIMALFAANYCNIFSYLSIVPKEYKYEICITVYFTLADILIDRLSYLVKSCINKKMVNINVILCKDTDDADENATPTFRFKKKDVIQFKMTVQIKGNYSKLKGKSIELQALPYIDYQWGKNGAGTIITDNGSLIIDLENLSNITASDMAEECYRVVGQRNCFENEVKMTVMPRLLSEQKKCFRIPLINVSKWFCKFNTNKAIIIMEEK